MTLRIAKDWRLRVLCLIGMALVSTYLFNLLLAWLRVDVWTKLFYLRWFLLPISATCWAAALFRTQFHDVTRSVFQHPVLAPLAQLLILAFAAAILVSCGDLAFEWSSGTSAMGWVLRDEAISKPAWATSSLILFAASAFTFALTKRMAAALLLIAPLFLGFAVANVLKVNYMDVAVQPLDVLRIPEFLPFFRSFFGTGALIGAVGATTIWLWALGSAARTPPVRVSGMFRSITAAAAVAVLVSISIAFARVPVSSSNEVLRLLGAPGRGFKEHARRHGVLLAFLSNLPAIFVSPPLSYSRAAVEEALARHAPAMSEQSQPRQPVNLVIYLVESMMDPSDFGVRYTSDPIPTIRSLRQTLPAGWVVVPEAFSGSANTEFEVLTGMSMCFLPRLSLAFRQYLRHSIPSLPRALKDAGYRTTAIQPDPKYFFARENAYKLLGFDASRWLDEVPDIERAARGSSPSDNAVVDAILEVSRQQEPFFVFAFPASTHAPYNQETYRESGLDVAQPMAREARAELQEYINAVHVADQSIARLIEHFSHRRTPTIIAVLGDHLPPLSSPTRAPFVELLSRMPPVTQSLRSRRVPLALWANFSLPKEDLQISANALAPYLLGLLNVEPRGFLAVSNAVRRKVPVLGLGVQKCGWGAGPESLDPSARAVLGDYELLQYDLLIGNNYAASARGDGSDPLPR